MSQKIKRRAGTARKAAAAQGKAARNRAVRARTGSALDAVMAWVPLSDEALHRVFLVIILGGAAALAAVVGAQAGVPALANEQMATVAANAGFEVHRVEVRGTQHLSELKVYERVLVQRDRAMTVVDLAALRADLLQLSWVKDARVSRQLPDTLVVDSVERKPHAVMRSGDHLVLIDETGAVLDPAAAADAKRMLVLSGNGVAGRVAALSYLLDAAPALKPQVAEAEWVGNRRWNILFKTGQVLALPEGDQAGAEALVSFARLDGTNRLLGGRVAAFDMRAPDRIYLRVPPQVASSGAPQAGASPATSGQAVGGVTALASATSSPAAANALVASGPAVAGSAAAGAGQAAAVATHRVKLADQVPSAHMALSDHVEKLGDVAKPLRLVKAVHLVKAAHTAKLAPAAKPVHVAKSAKPAIKPATKTAAKAGAKPAHLAKATHPAKLARTVPSPRTAPLAKGPHAQHLAKGAHQDKPPHLAKAADHTKPAKVHAASRPAPNMPHHPVPHTALREAN